MVSGTISRARLHHVKADRAVQQKVKSFSHLSSMLGRRSTSSCPTAIPLSPSLHPDLPARVIIELLRSGQNARFVARGASMWPAIPSRSRVEIEPCRAAQLQLGEVAAFESEGRVIVHRVTRVTAEGVCFQGDNCNRPDGHVPVSQVLGRMRALERRPLRLRWPRQGQILRACRALMRRLEPWLSHGTPP